MNDETPRYATLSDYLRVLRRQRLLIAVITLACTGLALAHALTKDSVYVASTQIQFRDPLADLNIVGITGDNIPELAPNQRSALNAQLLTRSEVTRRVAKDLKARVSPAGLRAAISANVDPQTNLVNLQASWGNAKFAAALANAYANAVRDVEVHDFRQRLRRAENALEQQLRIARQDLAGGTAAGAAAAGASFRVAALEQNRTQVRALERVADPVQIAGRAQVPGAPTSPRPVRDGILGFVLGLVLGLLVAFIRDALDRRLRTSQEVHDELHVPVLGRTGQTALKHNGLIANGKPALVESEFEAFRVLRTNLGSLANGNGKPPKVVLVTSPAPEEGKSTVSLSLACAAGLAGQRVLLLEADLRRPSLAPRVGVKPEPGLSDYLSEAADLNKVTQKARLAQPTPDAPSKNGSRSWSKQKAKTIDCIMAGKRVSIAPELLESPRMRDLLSSLRDTYDLVVIDGSPMLAVADSLEIAPLADAILVCVRAQRTTREQARAVRSALSHIEEKPTGAVLTGLQRGNETYGYYYAY
jgi:Mrp family chromosome partitioning ATPase